MSDAARVERSLRAAGFIYDGVLGGWIGHSREDRYLCISDAAVADHGVELLARHDIPLLEAPDED